MCPVSYELCRSSSFARTTRLGPTASRDPRYGVALRSCDTMEWDPEAASVLLLVHTHASSLSSTPLYASRPLVLGLGHGFRRVPVPRPRRRSASAAEQQPQAVWACATPHRGVQCGKRQGVKQMVGVDEAQCQCRLVNAILAKTEPICLLCVRACVRVCHNS